jgi:hypothetical protein
MYNIKLSDKIPGFAMIVFTLRTILLFGGIFLIWKGLSFLWELRPIRRKKYTTVVSAEVTELTEERRSASMNRYIMPRFEYEEDGEVKAFSPKSAYHPCRLKLGKTVTLCLAENGKFRTIRSELSTAKSIAMIAAGLVLVILQILV